MDPIEYIKNLHTGLPEDEEVSGIPSREDVSAEITHIVKELFDPNASQHSFDILSFSEFYGFPPPDDLHVLFDEHPHEYAYLFALLNADNGSSGEQDVELLRFDYIKEHIAQDVEMVHDAETVALVSEMPLDEELSMPERIDILADKYATYDELRRLSAISRMIFEKGCDASLLDYFEEHFESLYRANRDRISFDKSKKLEKETKKAEAFHLKGEIIANEESRKDLLKR